MISPPAADRPVQEYSVIDIRALRKWYPGSDAPALDDLSLHIEPGQVFGILGANGAGKSTLLQVMLGLLAKDNGEVIVGGHSLDDDASKVRALFGLIPQAPAFYPTLTVAENLEFFSAARAIHRGLQARETRRVCAISGLEQWLKHRAGRLSGGLQRRLNLAIGLLGKPPILCMDEPTVGVDPQSRQFILDSVSALANQGTTVLYTSHYMEEMQRLCDRVAIMDRGRILAQGRLSDLLNRAPVLRIEFSGEVPDATLDALSRPFNGRAIHSRLLELQTSDPADCMERLGGLLQAHNITPASVSYGGEDLQQLFFRLTGRALRD